MATRLHFKTFSNYLQHFKFLGIMYWSSVWLMQGKCYKWNNVEIVIYYFHIILRDRRSKLHKWDVFLRYPGTSFPKSIKLWKITWKSGNLETLYNLSRKYERDPKFIWASVCFAMKRTNYIKVKIILLTVVYNFLPV